MDLFETTFGYSYNENNNNNNNNIKSVLKIFRENYEEKSTTTWETINNNNNKEIKEYLKANNYVCTTAIKG